MPFCPNPECPNVKRLGKPAEYVSGATTCSDCGSELVNNEVAVDTEKRLLIGDFEKRVLYTLGMIALYRMLAHITVPGINFDALRSYMDSDNLSLLRDLFGLPRLSVFALGLMPYISASVSIEILAFLIKPLKSWRESGYQGRLKLRQTALIVTILFAFAHGYGIAHIFTGTNTEGVVFDRGLGFRLFITLTLITGTFILIGIADQITRRGIGHGICVLIFAGSAGGLLDHLSKLINLNDRHYLSKSPFEYLFLATGIAALLIAVITFMEKSNKRIRVKYADGMESYIPLKLTTAGIVPIDWVVFIFMLPATICGFTIIKPLQEIAALLSSSSLGLGYFIAYTVVIFLLYFLFTSFFYRPKDMLSSLQRKAGSLTVPKGKDVESYIDHALEIMVFAGATYLSFFFFFPKILTKLGFPIFIGGVFFIETVTIVLDLIEESRTRRKAGSLTKVAEFHEVYKAGLFRGVLEQRGIPCVLQGYYYRSLLYFFGPYIEISVLVPQDKSSEASELFEKYIA